MNQILVTEKIFVTPELKRKKKLYKMNFFLSVFLICLLFSYYIYAEFDKNKSEEVSQEILANLDLGGNFEIEDNTTARVENDVLIVTLDENVANNEEIDVTKLAKDLENYIQNAEQNTSMPRETYKTANGTEYETDAVLKIPSLDINYPVLKTAEEHIDEILKISLVKYWGHGPNEEGNYVIVGHNYKNKKMFGKLPDIEMGAIIELTDLTGKTIKYEVYDTYIVDPSDTSCTSQKTGGKKEITLITCRTYGTQRQVVKAREIK